MLIVAEDFIVAALIEYRQRRHVCLKFAQSFDGSALPPDAREPLRQRRFNCLGNAFTCLLSQLSRQPIDGVGLDVERHSSHLPKKEEYC
jgi:hypothetical protein